ncbi:MAG TPA: hypothetical protein VMP86_02095 [Candidatus Binatia bacterium]|nr:hypothetical protein [Candidatus Binatia bacterium]
MSRGRWIGLASIVAVAALLVGALIAVATLGDRSPVADPGETATASASASASVPSVGASASAAPSATSAAPASPEPGDDTGVLDTIWEVVVDNLVVRTEPSVANRDTILPARLTDGDRVLVVDGPRAADGYIWYQVLPIRPDGERERPFGWVASAHRDGEAWIVMEDLSCPEPSDLDAFLALAPEERLACFKDRTIEFRGGDGGCGVADGPVNFEPAWLAGTSGCGFGAAPGEIAMLLRFPPEVPQDFGPGRTVDVIGHFDDPAAETCRATSSDPATAPAPSEAEMVARCRTEFVVESVTPVP